MKKLLIFLSIFICATFAFNTWNSTLGCWDSMTWDNFHYASPIYNGSSWAYGSDGEFTLNCSQNNFVLQHADQAIDIYFFNLWNTNLSKDTSTAIPDHTVNYTFYYGFASERNFTINTIGATSFQLKFTFSNGTDELFILDDSANKTVRFYTNNTICHPSGDCIAVPTGYYNVSFYYNSDTASAQTNVQWLDDDSTWFFNPSVNLVYSNSIYIYMAGGSSTTNTTKSTYNRFFDWTTGWVWYATAYTGVASGSITLPNNVVFSDIGRSGVIGKVTNGFQAFILSPTSTIIQPKWTIYGMEIINTDSNTTVMYKNYNPATNVVPLIADTPTYIIGEDGICYFVPPYTPANYSLTYTMQAYYYTCGYTRVVDSIPKLPYLLYCAENNNTYNIQVNLTESVSHQVAITLTNGSVILNESTGSGLLFNYPLTNVSTINYTINTKQFCSWSNESSWFDIPGMVYPDADPDGNVTKTIFALPLFMATIAISTTTPFAFAFVFALNDYFEITSMDNIALLCILVGVMVSLSGWFGERNFKTLLAFFVIGATYLVIYHTTAGIVWDYTDNLTDSVENLRLQFENFDLLSIALALPTFLVNLILFILTLPLLIFDIILNLLFGVSPLIGSKFSGFYTAIVVIGYVYIALKGYEIVKNQFRSV